MSSLRTGLPALQPELILAHTHECLHGRPHPLEVADHRQGQKIRGLVLGAVSADHALEPTAPPPSRRPLGMSPIAPARRASAPAVLLQATDNVPALIPHALQQGFRGIPSVAPPRRRAATPPMARRAAPRQGQHRRGGASRAPPPSTRWAAHASLGPAQQDHGGALARLAPLPGEDPGQALQGCCDGCRHARVSHAELPPFPNA
jgi:hypothetical protein